MNVGGALAEARSEAGLTVTDVSKRTRIRETIIRDIERDDYSACGGDFYARGHIRAIARVVGTDPVPLIKEYDAARLPPPQAAANHIGPDGAEPSVSSVGVDPNADTNPELLDGPVAALPATVWDAARRRAAARKQAIRPGAAEVSPAYSPPGITAAEAFRPGLPMDFERRRPRGVAVLLLLVLALVGVVIYLLVSRSSPSGRAPAPPRSHHSAVAAARQKASPSSSPSTPAAGVAVALRVASAAAFGPAGTSQGDDPQGAPLAIDSSPTSSWTSDWYTTPQLGGLQSGTGLLLGLGNAATITSATVKLGATPGGTLELRAGDTPALADLPVVANSANPGGTLTMRLSAPVHARYVLLWFTSLPPDGAGTYQVRVYDIRLMGNRA